MNHKEQKDAARAEALEHLKGNAAQMRNGMEHEDHKFNMMEEMGKAYKSIHESNDNPAQKAVKYAAATVGAPVMKMMDVATKTGKKYEDAAKKKYDEENY